MKEADMAHPLVDQLRFTRSEFIRCLDGVSEEDGRSRLHPMNCISWIVGHLADQEHYLWLFRAQGKRPFPDLGELVGWGRPASTPSLEEMWSAWRAITGATDRYLDTLTPELLRTHLPRGWEGDRESVGTKLLRNIYHYWFHLGEAHAIRQMLGHTDLPQFVGDFSKAAHRPEL